MLNKGSRSHTDFALGQRPLSSLEQVLADLRPGKLESCTNGMTPCRSRPRQCYGVGACSQRCNCGCHVPMPTITGMARRVNNRVLTISSHLVHGPRRGDGPHDLLAAAVGADRQAAANDLAQSREVGRDAEVLLRASLGDAEAGHHLVEAQQRAVLARDVPQTLQQQRSSVSRQLPCYSISNNSRWLTGLPDIE